MLHIATSHSISPRWIEIQARHLREHIGVEYRTWASIALIDPEHGSKFDRVIEQKGPEPGRLNHLATEIAQEAQADDLLMFLSPDAFPIADPMDVIEEGLERAPLVAVRRRENGGERQPHPCFCVTTIGAWRELAGDWSDGYPWSDEEGRRVTDTGGNLLRRLELTDTPWVELSRSNPARLDPLCFAIYGGVVYHHGAGELARVHRAGAPRPLHVPAPALLGGAVERLEEQCMRLWERRTHKRLAARSEAIFARIAAGGSGWLAEVS